MKLVEKRELKEIIGVINKAVEEDISIVELNDNVGKWSSICRLITLSEERQEHVIKFAEMLDKTIEDDEEKIIDFISLSALEIIGGIDTTLIEDTALLMLADYVGEKTVEEIKECAKILSDANLLNVIRNKSLEDDDRKAMLDYVINTYMQSDIEDSKVDNYIYEMTNVITDTDIYKLIELINE